MITTLKLAELKKTATDLNLQIEELEKEIEIEKEEDLSSTFSKYVGNSGRLIAIKGEKLLKSFSNLTIGYGECNFTDYKTIPTYTKTTLDKLDKGDVFICCSDVEDIELGDFNIFIGKNNHGNYIVQYLEKYSGVEYIENITKYSGTEVYKFNR